MSRPRRSAFTATFVVEHHFTGFGQVSASLNLLTWLGARTTTLRLGTAVLVLPWHNPVLLAEQAATLDLLSGGRLDFGIGKGYRYNEFAGFCDADGRGRRALRRVDGGHHQGLHPRHAVRATRASTGSSTTSSSSRRRRSGRTRRSGWAPAASARCARSPSAATTCCSASTISPRTSSATSPSSERDVAARGRALRPDAGRRRPRGAFRRHAPRSWRRRRCGASRAICGSTSSPSGRATSASASPATTRPRCASCATRPRSSAPPTRSRRKLEALRDGGVEYVIVNFGGSLKNIRRFAREIMPAFRRRTAAGRRREVTRLS